MRLFHITTRTAWEAAKIAGEYRPSSLETEGFIHLSTSTQWRATANRFYRGQRDLILLWIVHRAGADGGPEIRFERVEPENDSFPHLYGPLAVDRVIETSALAEDEGGFAIPDNLRAWIEFVEAPPRIIPTSPAFDEAALAAHPHAGEVALIAARDHGRPVFYLCCGAKPGFEGKIAFAGNRWKQPPIVHIDATGWLQLGAFPRRADGTVDDAKLVAMVQGLIDDD